MPRTSTTLPAIEIDGESLGPAMQALNPRRRAFVIAKVEYGMSNVAAAKAAGFICATGDNATRLAHDERIQVAILEEGRKLMRSQGPKSIHTLVSIRDNEELDAKDRMKAAIELLNRSGFHATTEHHLSVEHRLSDGEMDRRILALAAELGLSEGDAKKMLIAPAEMKRNAAGVYQLAEPEPKPEPSPSALARRETRRRRKGMTPEEIEADKARIREERRIRGREIYREHDAARAAPAPVIDLSPIDTTIEE